jgi:hypothetical protein
VRCLERPVLVCVTPIARLTGPMVAAMLSTMGAPRAASTMSTLHEMWEAQQRERVFAEGERKTLLRLLAKKFGELRGQDVRRVEAAIDATLEMFLERVLGAHTLDAVLGSD